MNVRLDDGMSERNETSPTATKPLQPQRNLPNAPLLAPPRHPTRSPMRGRVEGSGGALARNAGRGAADGAAAAAAGPPPTPASPVAAAVTPSAAASSAPSDASPCGISTTLGGRDACSGASAQPPQRSQGTMAREGSTSHLRGIFWFFLVGGFFWSVVGKRRRGAPSHLRGHAGRRHRRVASLSCGVGVLVSIKRSTITLVIGGTRPRTSRKRRRYPPLALICLSTTASS